MIDTKHTPGPWSSDHEYEETWDTQTNIYVGVKNILIAQVCETDGNISNEEFEANARLIAAAPDLLEALKRIEFMCAAPPDFSDATMQEIARAAIAKATGQTP